LDCFGAVIIGTFLFIIKTVSWYWEKTRDVKPKPILAVSYPNHINPLNLVQLQKEFKKYGEQFPGYGAVLYPDSMTIKCIGGAIVKEKILIIEDEDRKEDNSSGL
jgi:hypothetical protein